jgi:hypothetical protein
MHLVWICQLLWDPLATHLHYSANTCFCTVQLEWKMLYSYTPICHTHSLISDICAECCLPLCGKSWILAYLPIPDNCWAHWLTVLQLRALFTYTIWVVNVLHTRNLITACFFHLISMRAAIFNECYNGTCGKWLNQVQIEAWRMVCEKCKKQNCGISVFFNKNMWWISFGVTWCFQVHFHDILFVMAVSSFSSFVVVV